METYTGDRILDTAFRQEIPVLRAEIMSLYKTLDQKLKLHASALPVEFILDDAAMGAYVPASSREEEHFQFALNHISRGLEKPLSKEDRTDVFRHEYAHYMQYHYPIPKEFLFEPGIHGSAFRYCCSLIGAAPTEIFSEGDGKKQFDYAAATEKKKSAPIVSGLENYRREQAYRAEKDTEVKFKPGDTVNHPKYGEGTVTEVRATETSVRLRVSFKTGEKLIDQKWLLKSRIRK